jgi:hypothetical protein
MAEALILAAPYLAAASAGVGVISSVMQGQQQAAAYEAQAGADRNNAAQSRVNAAVALNQSEAEVARTEASTRRRLATGFNLAAATGADPSYGSPLDVLGDIAAEGALDTQIQRWKGRAGANQAMNQAAGFERSAVMAEDTAKQASTAGFIRGGTTLLGGLAQYGSMRLRMTQPGAVG